jgi:hypothetical protein
MLKYHIDSQRLEVDEAVHLAHGGSIWLVVDCYHGCVKGDAFLLSLNGGVRTGHLMPSEATQQFYMEVLVSRNFLGRFIKRRQAVLS